MKYSPPNLELLKLHSLKVSPSLFNLSLLFLEEFKIEQLLTYFAFGLVSVNL